MSPNRVRSRTREPAPRTGVILAAGFGSRLAGTQEGPDLKPLTPVAGTPLLIRALRNLETAGCSRAVVVVGHGMETIRATVREQYDGPLEVAFAVNDRYDLQNGLSVLAAEPLLEEPSFLLTMADHVMEDSIMELAGQHAPPQQGATLLVDYKLAQIFDMDDATKVRVEEGRPQAIGKHLDDYNCVDTGVFVATRGLMEALSAVYADRGDVSLSDGIRHLIGEGRMRTLDIGDSLWQDVDTPEMLAHAEQMLANEPLPTD